ncbi:MAG: GNAT family N-acetyltransferase [Eubacterium sp.]
MLIRLEEINSQNIAEYIAFDKQFDSDLSRYQSRIAPDKNTELIKWCFIKADDKNIGSIWLEKGKDDKAILGVFIAYDDYRNKNIGTLAIKNFIDLVGVNEIYLHVRTSNARAIKCYHNVGFLDVSRYKKDNGIEVIEMKYTKEVQ